MLAFGLLVVGCGSPEDDSAESPDLIPMEEAQESVTDPAQVGVPEDREPRFRLRPQRG